MRIDKVIILLPLSLLLTACSMTKNIPEGEQLFTGVKNIKYADERDDGHEKHLDTTKEEIEAALATVPNGSLFGSSKYTVPWSWHLWVYNKYSQKQSKFARWMTKSFGKPPVLMSQVNPALRASVAQSVLRNNGYFRGDVTYEAVPQKNPKKSKISYLLDACPDRRAEREIERRMNELIAADMPVSFEFVDRSQLPPEVDASKLPEDASPTIRLVRIGDYDVCPCIGKHVRSTAQIGRFEMLGTNWDEEKRSFRIRFKIV